MSEDQDPVLEADDEGLLGPDGTPIRFGLVQPKEVRFAAVPAFAEANEVLMDSQIEEHDDFSHLLDPAKAQNYNNCTNTSLAWLIKLGYKAAGFDCPDMSLSYLYARNNGGRDAGAMCRAVVADWLQNGCPPASLWPENQIYVPRRGVPTEITQAAAEYKGLEVYQCMNWRDVLSALTRRFLIYQGFSLGKAFINRTGSDGVVPEWDGRVANGHATGACGIIKIGGKFRTISPNTWGTRWGKNGIGYIPESYYWARRGNFVNLDIYAIRAVKSVAGQDPPAAVA